MEPEEAGSATIDRRGAMLVAGSSAVSGLSSYVALILAARLLTVAQNTLFVTFWSAMFTTFGVLTGLSVEITRAVTSSRLTVSASGEAPTARGPRVIAVGLVCAPLALVVVLVSGLGWAPPIFGEGWGLLLLAVAVGATTFALHSSVVGSLAGLRRWTVYSGLIAADAVIRTVLLAVAGLTGLGAGGMAMAAAVGSSTWAVALVLSRRARAAVATRVDAAAGLFGRRVAAAALASGASAVLVVGFPTILAATTPAAEFAHAAPLLLAISFTRAPLLIPLTAFQGVLVGHLVATRSAGLRAGLPFLRIGGLVTAVVVAAAWLVGPPLLALVLGSGYWIEGPVLAGLTAGAAMLAALTFTGAWCQALTRHAAYVAGWLVAVAVAILLLQVPGELATRAVLALVGGPLAGVVVHVLALRAVLPHGQAGGASQVVDGR